MGRTSDLECLGYLLKKFIDRVEGGLSRSLLKLDLTFNSTFLSFSLHLHPHPLPIGPDLDPAVEVGAEDVPAL